MRTKQQIFDMVVEHLRKQREPALSDTGTCAYRGANGLKCAVGILIPDENYSKDIEGADCLTSIVRRCLPEDCLPHTHLLRDLQVIHDKKSVVAWEEEFMLIAVKHDLKYKEPKECQSVNS